MDIGTFIDCGAANPGAKQHGLLRALCRGGADLASPRLRCRLFSLEQPLRCIPGPRGGARQIDQNPSRHTGPAEAHTGIDKLTFVIFPEGPIAPHQDALSEEPIIFV
jgi:hypothetical protein